MAIGTGATVLEFGFYEFPEQEIPQNNDPFTINGDGSVDLDLSGTLDVEKKATFEGNVEITTGNLTIQEVNILEEINAIKQFIGMNPE
jgi:hypothetical protein